MRILNPIIFIVTLTLPMTLWAAGHSHRVKSVAFSPDCKTALSGSEDTTIHLWNLETGEEIIRMVGFSDGEEVAIMPQGYYAASPKGEQYINVRVDNQADGIKKYDNYKSFYIKQWQPVISKQQWKPLVAK